MPRYQATVGKYAMSLTGDPKRPSFDLTLVLRKITCDGKLVADHRWINLFKMLPFLGTLPGDKVVFEADTYTYRRRNGTEGWSFHHCKYLEILVEDEKKFFSSPQRQPIESKHCETLRNAMGAEYEEALTPHLIKGSYARLLKLLLRVIHTPPVASRVRRLEQANRNTKCRQDINPVGTRS